MSYAKVVLAVIIIFAVFTALLALIYPSVTNMCRCVAGWLVAQYAAEFWHELE